MPNKLPPIKNGTIIATRKEYDAIPALNYSGAKYLLTSPLHYKHYLTAERKETPALRVGSLTHAKVLEPIAATTNFTIAPDVDRRTKDGRLAYELFIANAQGKTVVTQDEWELADTVAASMNAILARIGVEFLATEFMFVTEIYGVPVKVAIDGVGSDGFIYDLKTTSDDASPRSFIRTAQNYKYNLQAYIYRMAYEIAFGERLQGFRIVAVEKEPPHAGACYTLGTEIMTNAAFDFEKAITLYKTCSVLDEWPGYPEDVQVIDIAGAKTSTASPINFA